LPDTFFITAFNPEIERLKDIPMRKKEKVRAKKKCWKTYLIDARDAERVYIKRRLGNILIGYLRSQGYLDDGTFLWVSSKL